MMRLKTTDNIVLAIGGLNGFVASLVVKIPPSEISEPLAVTRQKTPQA